MGIKRRNEWRYSFNAPKLWIIDARSIIILLGAGLNIHVWSVSIAVATILALYWVEKMKRMSLNSALRLIMSSVVNLIVGKRRSPNKFRKRHFLIDFEASRKIDLSAKQGQVVVNRITEAVAGIERRARNSNAP